MADDDKKEIDAFSGIETTGHEWDGLKELNNPLPRWWLWTFYLTVVWALGYTIFYPAWPLISSATGGVLGYSSRQEVMQDIAEHRASQSKWTDRIAQMDLSQIAADEELMRFALAGGAATFRTYCSQCHGAGAAGAKGFPNLLDDDWLWGGTREAIHETILNGIRWTDNEDTRDSAMPAFGADDILSREEIGQVVEYVYGLTHDDADKALAEAGAVVFEDNCAACHGDDATGMQELGAPNLADAIWLYGGDRETIRETVRNSRAGVMPAWGARLSEAEVKQVALYVHSLGGGVEDEE